MSGRDPDTAMPVWLETNQPVRKVLRALLDQLDKKPFTERRRPLGITLSRKHYPEFFRYDSEEDADYLWQLMEALAARNILVVNRKRQRVILREEAEEWVRQWLGRPVSRPLAQWREKVQAEAHRFPGSVEILSQRAIAFGRWTDDEVIQAFVKIGSLLDSASPRSQREISARCFAGVSKFLDGKERLLCSLYPEYASLVLPRPVMLQVCWPETAGAFLFIENQDTFLRLLELTDVVKDHVLVYGQGFKGGAERLRQPSGVVFSFIGSPPDPEQLEQTWFNVATPWPAFFWGDLDFSAMQMLAQLRKAWPGMEAWSVGYEPMCQALREGKGHPPEWDVSSGKGGQFFQEKTGCPYADSTLIPQLRECGCFLDQEYVGNPFEKR